ncbi:MAG TPA: glutathione S-transferase [Dongiaceae bacterium]|jgi:glutathione S-transferase
MKLIGMLDSPYVRRVAISFQLLGIPFEHLSLSVFRTFDQFRKINPVVKAPSLVCDDGEVLMDSTLILEYGESIAGNGRSLMPKDRAQHQHALHTIGVALAATEKSVQIVYERNTRPAEKQHAPWIERVSSQVLGAYELLESGIARKPLATASKTIDQAGIATAVAWEFTQRMIPDVVSATKFPALGAYSAACEQLAEFMAAPHGDGTYRRKA